MIRQLRGIVLERVMDSPRGPFCVVDVQGFGMEVLTTPRGLQHCPAEGESVLWHTALQRSETELALVGFPSREERDLFVLLISASGVGRKVALAVLSALPLPEIIQAVVTQNPKPLTAAKGVGTKLAQKMVIDLKEKFLAWRDGAELSSADASLPPLPQTQPVQEAEAVLRSLGYTPEETQASLRAALTDQPDATAEGLLQRALRWMATVA